MFSIRKRRLAPDIVSITVTGCGGYQLPHDFDTVAIHGRILAGSDSLSRGVAADNLYKVLPRSDSGPSHASLLTSTHTQHQHVRGTRHCCSCGYNHHSRPSSGTTATKANKLPSYYQLPCQQWLPLDSRERGGLPGEVHNQLQRSGHRRHPG